MLTDLNLLLMVAVSIAFAHTLMGPDHYLPFIVMSKARNWSLGKTTWITVLCGIGHVLSSVVLGFIGIALGLAVTSLSFIESMRGELAAWFLIAFGLVYGIWGLRNAYKGHGHSHLVAHTHEHNGEGHAHSHDSKKHKSLTPWVLFVIFVLGPCEPLIPLLMYPAAKGALWDVVAVSVAFGLVTIATMTGVVIAGTYGLKLFHFPRLARFGNAFAGLAICMSGLAIKAFGL